MNPDFNVSFLILVLTFPKTGNSSRNNLNKSEARRQFIVMGLNCRKSTFWWTWVIYFKSHESVLIIVRLVLLRLCVLASCCQIICGISTKMESLDFLSLSLSLSLSLYIYIYIYIYTFVCVCVNSFIPIITGGFFTENIFYSRKNLSRINIVFANSNMVHRL